jgi:hypothetical protein
MSQVTSFDQSFAVIGVRDGLELAIKRRSTKGLGKTISGPDSAGLIAGVAMEPLQIHPDDRGFFAELARLVRAA